MDKVFKVPELLTTILLHLPVLDILLRARPVNKLWKEIIDTTPRLLWATWKLNRNLYPNRKDFSSIVEPNNILIEAIKRQPVDVIMNSSPLHGGHEEAKAMGIRWVGHRYWYYKCKSGVRGDPVKEAILAKALEKSKLRCLARDRHYCRRRDSYINASACYISLFEDSLGIRTALESMYMTRPPLRKMTITFYYLEDGEKVKVRVEDLVIREPEDGRYVTAKTFLREISLWLIDDEYLQVNATVLHAIATYTDLGFLFCNYLQNMTTVSAEQGSGEGLFEMVFPCALKRLSTDVAMRDAPRWNSELGVGHVPEGDLLSILEPELSHCSNFGQNGRDSIGYI